MNPTTTTAPGLILMMLAALTLSPAPASGAQWSWQWPAAAGDAAPTAEICEFKYGKDWAYAIEIDDGKIGTLTVIQPLVSQFGFTDAPPGVEGGKPLPFVGGAALIVGSLGTANGTMMQWDDVHTLEDLGWGILSHSYAHQGHAYGNPPQILTPAQFRTDLFWSQAIFADHLEAGRAPVHFVYPNGYTDYRDYLVAYGLHSASRVGAPKKNMDLYSEDADFLDLTRAYLDTGVWTHSGKGEPMWAFPKGGPPDGHLHIDFTHGINADPDSDSHNRWETRLSTIAAEFGAAGRDNLWCAPTGEIISYVRARQAAEVNAEPGRVTVRLPDDQPGSSLTLRITGIDPAAELTAPDGGAVYRDGDAVYVTSPVIGEAGSPAPTPAVTCLYAGEIKDLHFDEPVAIAAVRLLRTAPVPADFDLRIDATTATGTQSLLPPGPRDPGVSWHQWMLFDAIPNGDPVVATELHVSPHKHLTAMEVWVVAR